MRNKNRKAEDQLSLIPSSDSEEDSSAPKQTKSVREDKDASLDSMWNEVASDTKSENSGTEISISSTSKSSSDGFETKQTSDESDEQNSLKIEIMRHVKPEKEKKNLEINSDDQINETNEEKNHGSQKDSEDMQEQYAPAVEAIRSLSKSEYSAQESWNRIQFDIENVLKNSENNYEPLEELEETMMLLTQLENIGISVQAPSQLKTNKTSLAHQISNEIDANEINNQLKKDFEELSTNMANFVKELDKEKEQSKEIIEPLFNTQQQQQQNMEDNSSDTNEQEIVDDEKKWNRIIDEWDKETKLTKESTNLVNEELLSQDIKDNESQASRLPDFSENSLYEPLDITFMSRHSREAMNSFEKEANELKKLLQKLETENDVLFNEINIENKSQMENQKPENKEKKLQDIKQEIVFPLLHDILQSLEIVDKCPVSYKFPETFGDIEDNNHCKPLRIPDNPTYSENIPQFRATFKQFFQDVKNKNKQELTTAQQKSFVLKEMAERPQHNCFRHESPHSVNAQLEEFKRHQKAKISRLVDRVYAQKERYNDTLELSDGKLMVRNRDTGELTDMPEPIKHDDTSDRDTDYDTALSDSETENPIFVQSWRKTFKPTARKSSEHLITQALNENNCYDSDDSNDEFYSLEAQNKSSLDSIDREFFNKLTLEHLVVSEADENHIAHCARSYEELKQYLKLNKEGRSLTAEETELLESMIEKKTEKSASDQLDCVEPKLSTGNLTEAEKTWFDKMLKEGKDEQNSVPYKQTLTIPAGIKLYEYKFDNDNESSSSTTRHWPANDTDSSDQIRDKGIFTFVYESPGEELNINDEPKNQKRKLAEGIDICKQMSCIQSMEFPSDEEKADIESNIDNESKCAAKKINANATSGLNTSTANLTSDTKMLTMSSSEIEVLECNLEIIDCNEEVVDTITINAEVHY